MEICHLWWSYLSKSVIFPSLAFDIWNLEYSPIFGTACNFLSSAASPAPPKSAVGRCFRPVALPLRSPLWKIWEHDVLIHWIIKKNEAWRLSPRFSRTKMNWEAGSLPGLPPGDTGNFCEASLSSSCCCWSLPLELQDLTSFTVFLVPASNLIYMLQCW